ncbi:STAS/SEC14 domain-containing protein [Thalassotalea piscium]
MNECVKVVIYGNKKWQEFAAKSGYWFIFGEITYFGNNREAISWLNE